MAAWHDSDVRPAALLAAIYLAAPNPKMIPNYVTGIQAAKAKMVARVGQAEADKWERNAINSAARYEAAYSEARRAR